jgi:dihydroorotase
VSAANYSFFMGTANDNGDEVLRAAEDRKNIAGVKIFMGSSTGSMLVDNYLTLDRVFGNADILIATHCEDERIIAANKEKFGEVHDVSYHPVIRDEEACFESSFSAVQLAKKHGSRLHILHISTERELQLFSNMRPLCDKRITAEVCVHHLHFTADDYERLSTRIQCNPAIKAPHHREALWKALLDDTLDIIATDHAPHTAEEKAKPYPQSPSGLPLVQHSLLMMLDYVREGRITLEKVVEKMAHAPAECFRVEERGFLREGYWADMVLANLNSSSEVTKESLLYKCGWSPLEGTRFSSRIEKTWVNGEMVWNGTDIAEGVRGARLRFDR